MSPSAGCTHDMLLVDSDAQMVTALEPFVRAGTAAGDLVILQGTGQQLDLLRRAFGYGSGVRVEPAPDPFLGPMPTIAHYQRICERANAAGRAVRASGPTPALLEAIDRSRWLEYEALLSRGVAPYRFTGLCRYDTRTAPREAVAAALRTHQHLVTPRGRWPLPTPSAPTRPPAADDATASSPIVID